MALFQSLIRPEGAKGSGLVPFLTCVPAITEFLETVAPDADETEKKGPP